MLTAECGQSVARWRPKARRPALPRGRHRPPPHWLPGARGFTPAVLLPEATAWTDAPAVGLLGAPASIPKRSGLGRKVHQCERCESDRVADRPFALHAEAPDRRGRGTRLASPVRAGVATRIAGRPKPLFASAPSPESPLGLATQGVVKTASPDPSPAQREAKSRCPRRARKRRCSFGLRDSGVGSMWTANRDWARQLQPLSTPCGIVERLAPTNA